MTAEMIALVLAAVAVLAVVGLGIFIHRAGMASREHDVARELTDIKVALAGRDSSLDTRVAELDSKLALLQTAVTSREATLDEQVRGLGAQMSGIAGLFSNDRARGGWGEISLLRVFELGGLSEGRDFVSQFKAGDRTPDAVVNLPGDRKIVIDSKFPIARYNEAIGMDDTSERQDRLVAHGKELERVGGELITRGYGDLASGGYVVMYLASQAVYEAAAEASPEIIDRLLKKRVVVAGPTALYSLLMNVGALMTEHRALQQADEILSDAKELNARIGVFVNHLHTVGSTLTKTVNAFNAAAGSWASRVSPQLTRFTEMSGTPPMEELVPIDDAVRRFDVASYPLPIETVSN